MFVKGIHFVQKQFFLTPVQRSELVGTFKKHMLQIMSQASIVAGISGGTRPRRNECEDARFLLVHTQHDRQPIFEPVKPGLHGVIGQVFISVPSRRDACFPGIFFSYGLSITYRAADQKQPQTKPYSNQFIHG